MIQSLIDRLHFSNVYFGGSLKVMCDLGRKKGYEFVGTNSNGVNAFLPFRYPTAF